MEKDKLEEKVRRITVFEDEIENKVMDNARLKMVLCVMTDTVDKDKTEINEMEKDEVEEKVRRMIALYEKKNEMESDKVMDKVRMKMVLCGIKDKVDETEKNEMKKW